MTDNNILPAVANKADGTPRRVGTEIEFAGVSIGTTASLIADHWGGNIQVESDYEYKVVDSHYGDFKIELDFEYLKKRGQSRRSGMLKPNNFERVSEDILAAAAKQVVPCEVVSPPMAIADMPVLDELCARLAEQGAQGTGDSLLYAFGVHFNPEIPALDASLARDYLQAFVLLSEWIIKRSRIDLSRRISTFADPFPRHYVSKIIQPDYAPDWSQLIDDYIDDNPTRNRGLDMLPMFAHVDETRVRSRLSDSLIKSRPTFHYRLPNCRLGEADWTIMSEWQYWLRVEQLAQDASLRSQLMKEYLQLQNSTVSRLLSDWPERMDEIFDV